MSEDNDDYTNGYHEGVEDGRASGYKRVITTCFVFAYLIVGALTFAWIYETSNERDFGKGPGAVLAAPVWPLYWAGQGALVVVRKYLDKGKQAKIEGSLPVSSGGIGLSCHSCSTITIPNSGAFGTLMCMDGIGATRPCQNGIHELPRGPTAPTVGCVNPSGIIVCTDPCDFTMQC